MTASPVAATTVQFNPETRFYIDGRLRDSSTGKTVDNVDQIRARNPKIIYARGHGYGTRGDLAGQGGFDLGAYWSRGGIAGALFKRERTEEPSVVDVSLLNAAIWPLGPDIVGAGITGQGIPKFNLAEMPNPVASIYKTRDIRFVAFVLLQADRFWADFCGRLGRPDLIDDERYANAVVRFGNRADCIVELRKAFESEDLSHWERAFAGFEGVWDVVHTAYEVHSDPQALANGYLPRATNSSGIEFALAATPVQYDETPLELERAPEHGEHTDALLAELGFSEEEIMDFKINSVAL